MRTSVCIRDKSALTNVSVLSGYCCINSHFLSHPSKKKFFNKGRLHKDNFFAFHITYNVYNMSLFSAYLLFEGILATGSRPTRTRHASHIIPSQPDISDNGEKTIFNRKFLRKKEIFLYRKFFTFIVLTLLRKFLTAEGKTNAESRRIILEAQNIMRSNMKKSPCSFYTYRGPRLIWTPLNRDIAVFRTSRAIPA